MDYHTRRRLRRHWVENGQAIPGDRKTGQLVDLHLNPEAAAAARATELSFIEPAGRRAVAVFLGLQDYEKFEYMPDETLGNLMLECLPKFIHECEGQIAFATRMSDRGDAVNPILHTVTINERVRSFLREGYLFIDLPNERLAISAEEIPVVGRNRLSIVVRSNVDSAGFWQGWQDYARIHSYLRGQAFFADGEIIKRKRTYSWDDILLPDQTRRTIQTHVDGFLRNRKRLKRLGVKARRGLILAGPPGTGKTLLGKVLADTLDVSFMWVSPRHVNGVDCFEAILSVARFVAPAVVFLEDMDLFAEERDHNGWIGLGELMNQLDGALDNEDLITIATTNRLEVIEKALRNRPGRFDRIVKFEPMEAPCRRKLLEKLLAKAAVAPADLNYLVEITADYTGAQVEELVNTVYILAMDKDNDEHADEDGADPTRVFAGRQLIDAALGEFQAERKARFGFHAA